MSYTQPTDIEYDELIDQIIAGLYQLMQYPAELESAQRTAATNSDARRFLEQGREWREQKLRAALQDLISKVTR